MCFSYYFQKRHQIESLCKQLLEYSKHPHIRTHDFGGQADRVLI